MQTKATHAGPSNVLINNLAVIIWRFKLILCKNSFPSVYLRSQSPCTSLLNRPECAKLFLD